MARFRQQIKLIEQVFALKHLANIPAHALFQHGRGTAKPVPNFQCALGKADGARTLPDAVLIIQQYAINTTQYQINRECQAHRAGANDYNWIFNRRGARLIGVAPIGKTREGLRGLHALILDSGSTMPSRPTINGPA